MKFIFIFTCLLAIKIQAADSIYKTNDLRGFALRFLGAGFNPATKSISPTLCCEGTIDSEVVEVPKDPIKGVVLTKEDDERIPADKVWVEFNIFSKYQKWEYLKGPYTDVSQGNPNCKSGNVVTGRSMGGSFYFLQMFTVRDEAAKKALKATLNEQVGDLTTVLTMNIAPELALMVDYQYGGSGTSEETRWITSDLITCSRDQSKCKEVFAKFQKYAETGLDELYTKERVSKLEYTSEDMWADYGVDYLIKISNDVK